VHKAPRLGLATRRHVATPHTPAPPFRTNRLLGALTEDEYAALRPHLTAVQLGSGDTIYRSGERFAHAYFPLAGTASLVAATHDGGMVEVGSVGREGLVGLAALHDADGGPLETFA